MKRILVILSYIACFSTVSYCSIEETIADSINSFAANYAKTSRIKVEDLTIRGNSIILNTSKQLSYLSLNESDVQDLRDMVSRIVFSTTDGFVKIYTDDKEIRELITQRNTYPSYRQHLYTIPANITPLIHNESKAYDCSSGLDGIHIALYGSHGLYYNQNTERWVFQRAKLLTTVEDLFTSSYVHTFLAPMLENAGAIVFEPRERDMQEEEHIVDDSEIYLTNGWERTDSAGYGVRRNNTLRENENPFRMGGYAYAECNDRRSKEIRYIPNIHKSGEYAVYISYKTLPNSADNVQYEVVHCGQHTVFSVNQKMGGGTWIYLGTFKFSSGNGKHNYVSVSNSGEDGCIVTSDAVRFGGGMGSVARYKQDETDSLHTGAMTSGSPRYMEGARYWLQYAGIPDSVYNFTGSKNDYTDDFTSRGRWINYLSGGSEVNPTPPHTAVGDSGLNIPIHLGLAFHSDAGIVEGDSTIGTLLIYTDYNNDLEQEYPIGVSRLSARSYADFVQTQIVNDIRVLFDSCWTRRELMNASYSESRNPDMPMILLELLSHQNLPDMRLGLDPRFRFAACRAIYKGILRYLHTQYGTEYIVQPLPVHKFSVEIENQSDFRLRWSERKDTLEATASPDYYIVYTRIDDGDWDNGTRTYEQELLYHGIAGHRYDFKVVAGNKGGISMPSEILCAYKAKKEQGRVLIINGFDRVAAPESFMIDSTYAGIVPWSYAVPYGKDISYIGSQYEFRRDRQWISDDASGWGSCYSDYSNIIVAGNTFDYPTMHGRELQKYNISFASASAESITEISRQYDAVDVILGKQRSTYRAQSEQVAYPVYTESLKDALRNYGERNGNILISGAYIGSDMTADSDRQFLKDVLHIRYVTSNATKNGKIDFANTNDQYTLICAPNPHIIHCENPDGIAKADKSSKTIARFGDSGVGCIVYSRSNNKVITCSMPLESIAEFSDIYEKLIFKILRDEEKEPSTY